MREEIYGFILNNLSEEEQLAYNEGQEFHNAKIITPANRKLRDLRNNIQTKVQRLYGQLGKLVYGDAFGLQIGAKLKLKRSSKILR